MPSSRRAPHALARVALAGALLAAMTLAAAVGDARAPLPDCSLAPVVLRPLYDLRTPGADSPEAAALHLAAATDSTIDLGTRTDMAATTARQGTDEPGAPSTVVALGDGALRGVANVVAHPAGGWMVDDLKTCATATTGTPTQPTGPRAAVPRDHQASSYYDLYWFVPSAPADAVVGDGVLLWAFSPTFEEAGREDAIAATESWNEHADALRFQHVGDVADDPGMGPCPATSIVRGDGDDVNVARRGEIDGPSSDGGGILALAALCPVLGTTTAYHFTVTYDQTEPWHFGPPPVPADRFDLQGILAHEFGHATGWGRHFQENTGTECITAARHTMCATVAPGTDDPRSLEEHDIHTFQEAY